MNTPGSYFMDTVLVVFFTAVTKCLRKGIWGGKVYFGSQLERIWPSWCRRPGSGSVRPRVTLYLQLGGRRRWMLINDELTFFSFLSFFPFTHSCIWYRSSDLHLQTTKDTRNFKNITKGASQFEKAVWSEPSYIQCSAKRKIMETVKRSVVARD